MTNTNKPGYKETKLGWIPEKWEAIKLGELSTKIGSGSTPRGGEKVYIKEGIPFIRSQNVNNNQLLLDGISHIPFRIHEDMKGTKVFSSDILLNITGASIGRSCVVPDGFEEGNVNQHVCIIRLKQGIDKNYIQLFLSSRSGQKTILRVQVGGNREGLTRSGVQSILVPLPPLPEQQKIANILSTWDKAISHTQALISRLQDRKKGLMQQLLTGKTRLKGFSGDWEEVQLGDIADRITTKNKELNDTVITISAQRGFIRQEDFFKKRVASSTLSGYYLINRGDFAYNKSYSNGYPMGAFKRLDTLEKAVVTTLYICFRLKKNIDSDFLLNYFECGLMVKNLMKIAQEGGRAHGLLNISLGDFFNLKLKIPSLKEQKAIAKILNTADQEISYYESYLASLQNQKKGLMQQLLTGQRRVKV